jgi:hypothetical protein
MALSADTQCECSSWFILDERLIPFKRSESINCTELEVPEKDVPIANIKRFRIGQKIQIKC